MIRSALAPGIAAVRAYWKPFVAIQVLTALVVVAYYASAQVREACIGLAAAKAQGGFVFSAATGAIAGGIVPELAKLATLGVRPWRGFVGDSLYNGLIFAIIGVQVDLLYRGQALLFGGGHAPTTLAIKVAVDQGLYTPLMSIPLTVGLVRLRDDFRDAGRLFGNWTPKGWRRFVAPNLPTAWAFWVPVLICVYSMPVSLQYCLAVLAEAAWSLLFVFAAQASPQP